MKEEPPGDGFALLWAAGGQDLADEEITRELAVVGTKHSQLRTDMRGLKRKLSQRKKDHEKIQLRLSALNNVASELSALQDEYQEHSRKNVALVQELLVQIGQCADQVDSLKHSRDLTRTELREIRLACAEEMGRLMKSLDELRIIEERSLAQGYADADKSFAVNSAARQSLQQRLYELGYDQNRAGFDNVERTASGSSPEPAHESRIDVVSRQLDELRDQIYRVEQGLQHNKQTFRQQLEDLLAHQMTQIREVQDDEAERMYEEMDGLRSGMITILKDMHILKERTKYMVPNMSKVSGARLRRHRKPPVSTSTPSPIRVRDARPTQGGGPTTPGYSLMMTTRMCDNEAPHLEHGYSSDWYCPGVPEVELPAHDADADPDPDPTPHANAEYRGRAPEQGDDSQWVQYREDDMRRELDQPPFPPCESPHYSSRSSGVSDRLSANEGALSTCYGWLSCCLLTWLCVCFSPDHVVPVEEAMDEDLERRLLEQHRQFWIVEGAG
jgi:uncharacterized coiled-coil DUF342 family protein